MGSGGGGRNPFSSLLPAVLPPAAILTGSPEVGGGALGAIGANKLKVAEMSPLKKAAALGAAGVASPSVGLGAAAQTGLESAGNSIAKSLSPDLPAPADIPTSPLEDGTAAAEQEKAAAEQRKIRGRASTVFFGASPEARAPSRSARRTLMGY